MASVAGRSPRLRRSLVARPALVVGGACLALAALSLTLPWRPTYDPWAWIVFGREVSDPHLQFSTLAHTGWKPLAVLFTVPFGLFGGAAPFLWLLVPRAAGLAALALAYRLAWRAGGVVAGVAAALALLFSADWLRYIAAGNIEPLAVALLLGAVELHLARRRGWAFALGALCGLARPEIWPLVGIYSLYLWRYERSWWPLLVGIPAMIVLWVVPDWAGSGQFLHTFHSATVSGEPTQILNSSNPAAKLTGGALGILVAPVWIAALVGAVLRLPGQGSHHAGADGDRPVLVRGHDRRRGDRLPSRAAYLVEPAAVCCVLAGIGFVMAARLIPEGPARVAAIVLLVATCVPFAVARSIGLGKQVTAANQRADDLSDLWRSVDRAGPRAELAPFTRSSRRTRTRRGWRGSCT